MKIKIDNFDLKKIAESGQCFRWRQLNIGPDKIGYAIPAFGNTLIALQNGNEFEFSCDEEEWNLIWKNYFDIDRNYYRIGIRILEGDDNHLIEAYEFGKGIRILKQDLWETMFSFMVSQNNNISRISESIERFCKKSHDLSQDGTDNIPSFPNYDEISTDIFNDSSLGFGYRSVYLKDLCEYVCKNPTWLDDLRKMSYEEAMESLMLRNGIGKKVASCICLFGLGHVEAFPIDTHIKQLIENHYSSGLSLDRYADCAGIIQQYLFYYDLKANNEK